jgi:hypothetical protein
MPWHSMVVRVLLQLLAASTAGACAVLAIDGLDKAHYS